MNPECDNSRAAMFPRTLDNPPLINVSAMPSRLAGSMGSGWDGALVVEVTAAPGGEVRQEHEFLVIERRLTPLSLRPIGGRGGWRTHGPGAWMNMPGERIDAEWRSATEWQYLLITPARAEAILGRPWHQSGLVRWSDQRTDLPFAQNVLAALVADFHAGHPAGPLVGDSLLVALLAHLDGMKAAPAVPRRGALARRIHLVRDYIEENLARPLKLAELAAVAGVSVRQLGDIFAMETGWPPHRYVLHRRVERAKQLMATPELSLSHVALAVGFKSPAQFSRVFHQYAGMAPRTYRCR